MPGSNSRPPTQWVVSPLATPPAPPGPTPPATPPPTPPPPPPPAAPTGPPPPPPPPPEGGRTGPAPRAAARRRASSHGIARGPAAGADACGGVGSGRRHHGDDERLHGHDRRQGEVAAGECGTVHRQFPSSALGVRSGGGWPR